MPDIQSAPRAALPSPAGAKEPLQVRIPVAVKRRFKSHAALRGLEPNELFVELWEQYEATLPRDAAGKQGTGTR